VRLARPAIGLRGNRFACWTKVVQTTRRAKPKITAIIEEEPAMAMHNVVMPKPSRKVWMMVAAAVGAFAAAAIAYKK